MTSYPLPENETERLAALDRLKLLDNRTEQDFDDIVYLASQICETPISYISFIDANKQWFKSKVGLKATHSPREISLCSYTILGDEILIVPDTTMDERFSSNPVVSHPPHFRFYAGIPVKDPAGYPLGTLCVVDYKARELTEHQQNSLRILAKQVSNLLEIRSKEIRLQEKKELLESNEQKLKNIAFQLNAYFNSTSDAILLLNPQFEIVAFNKFASITIQTLYKKSIESVKNILELIEKDRQPNFIKNLESALQGQEVKVEVYLPQFENTNWWDISFLPVKNDAQEVIGIAYICASIDEKKKAEEALKSSEKRLSLILANSNDGWWDRDLEKNIWYFSDSWCKLLGYSKDETPKSLEELRNFVHPDDFEKTSHFIVDNHSPVDQLFEVEIRLKHKNGNYIPILSRGHILKNDEGKAIRVSGTNIDLTERKKTEEQLKVNERQLSLIFNSIQDIIFVIEVEPNHKFKFTSINHAFVETTGLAESDIIGKYMEDVIAKESLELVKSNYIKAIETKSILQWEETSTYPNGTKTGIVSINPIFDETGRCIQLIGSVHEITERKKIEGKLAENQRFLQTLITNLPGYSYRVKNDKNYTAEYI
ncbi:MAG: PAS domain S-box protein, partial [Cytophagales bacterium]|nr:PAS domain S-box protein [Cytophagales bacterium]